MPFYECVFIARQDTSTTDIEKLADDFTSIIEADKGKVTKRENWGLRQLAYRIQKNKKGHYVLLNIDAPYSAIAEMERNMRINENILRFMTVKVEQLEDGPSAMMAKPHDIREGASATSSAIDFVDEFAIADDIVDGDNADIMLDADATNKNESEA